MALTERAVDEQSRWAPAWFLEIDPLGWGRRYATDDFESIPHEGRILNEPTIRRSLMDVQWGPLTLEDLTVELANGDGALTGDYQAGYEGKTILARHYDAVSGFLLAEWTGVITEAELGRGVVRLTGSNFDTAIFDDVVPSVVVNTALFPLAAPGDLGKAVPVIFGNVPQVPLLYVHDDKVNSYFLYMIGHGTLGISGAWRNGPNDTLYPMTYSEFEKPGGGAATSWAEVARADIWGGYTVVRPFLRQTDFSGGMHRLYASVTGFQDARNFARAVRRLLGDTWGLGRSVNAASFTTAEALLDPALVCDGAMLEQRPAREWLEQLLMVRGMRLATNAAGEWTITVDTQATERALTAQDGIEDGERTLLSADRRTKPPLEDRCRDLVIRYRRTYGDGSDDDYRFEQRRVVNVNQGRNIPKDNGFLRDHTAADRVADYLGKRLRYGQETVEVTLTQDARRLAVGDIVALRDASIGYVTPTDLEVREVRKGLWSVEATLQGWAEDIYTYTPGSLPADEMGGFEVDASHTAPDAPTGLTVSNSGTRVNSNGQVSAWVYLQFGNPTTNWSYTILRYRVTGTTPWMDAGTTSVAGWTEMLIENLQPDMYYDFSARSVNQLNLMNDSAVLGGQLMATDDSVPDAPYQMSSVQAGAKLVQVNIGVNTPSDFAQSLLYRNTVNNPGGAMLLQWAKAINFHDEYVDYGVTYYYWARIQDSSGNVSGFSPTTSTTVQYHYGSDIASGTVTGGNIAGGTITGGNVAGNTISTGNIAMAAVTGSASAGGSVGLNSNYGWSTICTVGLSISAPSSYILLNGYADIYLQSTADNIALQATIAIQVGGYIVASANASMRAAYNGWHFDFPGALVHLDSGRSGYTTYTFLARYGGDSGGSYAITSAGLQVTELKR